MTFKYYTNIFSNADYFHWLYFWKIRCKRDKIPQIMCYDQFVKTQLKSNDQIQGILRTYLGQIGLMMWYQKQLFLFYFCSSKVPTIAPSWTCSWAVLTEQCMGVSVSTNLQPRIHTCGTWSHRVWRQTEMDQSAATLCRWGITDY